MADLNFWKINDIYLLVKFSSINFCYILPGQTLRDFGDTLGDCLNPVTKPDNFCAEEAKLIDVNGPNSFLRYRNVSGICNNLIPGKATVAAAGTITGRFFKSMLLHFFLCCISKNMVIFREKNYFFEQI